jgi:hypothetical protein
MKFEPGNTFGMNGRPMGARNKFASSVFNDVMAVWNEPVREGNPLTKGKAAMLAMCRTTAPKNAIVEWDSVDDAVAFYKSKAWTDLAPQRDKTQKTIRRYAVEAER